MKQNVWWALSVEEVAALLRTNLSTGLTNEEAQARLAIYGKNKLPSQKKISAFTILVRQFANLIVGILIGALSISAFLGEWVDALAIGVIIVLNALIGFIQEYSAERSLEALKELIYPTSRVIRDEKITAIESSELVPGDCVLLEMGDKVPADGRIIQANGLFTQEAALTGESISVFKEVEKLPKSNS